MTRWSQRYNADASITDADHILVQDAGATGSQPWTKVATIENLREFINSDVSVNGEWGGVKGTLSDQTDLQAALNAKAAKTDAIKALVANGTSIDITFADGDTATLALPVASQAEAEAGTATAKLMNPLRTAQAIAALAASDWGDVGGTLSDQTDLQTALDARVPKSAGLTSVEHGATAGTARPSGFGLVVWYGTVEPTNAANNDFWVDTTT